MDQGRKPLTSNPGTVATTSIFYDNNGNVIQVGTTTFYTYDYANRLTQSSIKNGTAASTTITYAYGPFGERVSQTNASSTILYPNKFYSVASSTGTGAKYATTTEYLYTGSNLLATIDQKVVSGTATGTPATRYIHPDNLGSTNVTSDSGMQLIQTFDYAPYGSVIASTNASSTTTTLGRQYIGEFSDASGLSYLNARYLNASQGQFTAQDPTFWGKQNIGEPQSLNSYSYANDNPITGKDPKGDTAYYFDNGHITFTAPFFNNLQYTESQQRQMLNNNAALMENHRLDPFFFKDQVQNGGPMDYKNGPDSNRLYFMNGGLVKSEAFGNYNYGYVGTAAGFGGNILTDMAGLYGIYRWGNTGAASPQFTNVFNNFDQRNDSLIIQQGVNDYLKNNPSGASAAASSATNGAYVQSGAQDVSRVAATIAVTLQAIRVATAFLATYTGK